MAKSTAKTTKKTTAAAKPAVSKSAEVKKTRVTVGTFLTKNRKPLLIGGTILIVGALAFLGKGLFIAATVNGQPISRLSIIQDIEKQLGQTTLEKEITRSLVNQEAAKKNVTASDEDIEKEIKKISDQFKEQGQDLNQLMQAQGIKQEDFREDIKMQILVQKMLGDQTSVTDKEVDDYIKQNEGIITEEEDQAKAKANIKVQLQQQKLSQKYQEWIAGIRKNANVMQFVEYK